MSATAVGQTTRPRALLALACAGVALAAADTYVVVLALTDMMAGVGLTLDSLQRATPIISGFLLGYIAVLPLIGRLADLVPRGRVLLACLVLFVLGSGVTALAVDLDVLVAGRVVQGIGGGGLVPATLAIVAYLWPVGRRGVPLGMVGAVQELGSVLGPVLGAAVLAVADWRAIFWLNVVLALVLAVALRVVDREGAKGDPPTISSRLGLALGTVAVALLWLALAAPRRLVTDVTLGLPFVPLGGTDHRLVTPVGALALALGAIALAVGLRRWWPTLREGDLVGALLLGTALGCVVLTFAAADPEREVVGPLGYALLPVALVAAGLFAWRQRTAPSPLVPRGTLGGRTGWALLVSVLVGVALVSVVVDVPLLARLTTDGGQTHAAMVLLRFLIAVPVGALVGGWLLRHLGAGLVAGTGLALMAAGLGAMSTWGTGSLAAVVSSTAVLVMAGLGAGLALAPVNDAALADAPSHAHGTASSLVVVARMIGMVVGLALLTGVGLHRYYEAVAALSPADRTSADALVGAAMVQVETVFAGAALAAGLGAVVAVLTLGRSPERVRASASS
ncbi:MFS transporter [Janibacter melonis]|uniref:MFS transporter n=1 Tax=Janibacter melonis TaxID=262209 RepID=UPI002043A3EF|nr:MFS transporter [Janibacter melonis]MCM3556230.1 MFS transporter [Janibacter melonis]